MVTRSLAKVPPKTRPQAREAWVEELEARFTPIASGLGLLFLLVVIGENLATSGSTLQHVFFVVGWLIWGAFVLEFGIRIMVAPSKKVFLKRNWWQVVFLVLPFLRFIAALRLARLGRAGRIVGSAVRGSRSAGQVLRGRLTSLGMIHLIVVLSASQLLFEFGGDERTYGDVLHAVALASVSGEPLGLHTGLAQVMDIVLALYAVVLFASAAGALGAYFLTPSREDDLPNE